MQQRMTETGLGLQRRDFWTSVSGSGLNNVVSTLTPDTPSTMQWCTLATAAKQPSGRPSMNQSSHRGRVMLSGCDVMRPASSASCDRDPGLGSPAW